MLINYPKRLVHNVPFIKTYISHHISEQFRFKDKYSKNQLFAPTRKKVC